MSKMFHHIALLLTFGVACPPLAVAILLTVCLTTFMWELLVGRYVAQKGLISGAAVAGVASHSRDSCSSPNPENQGEESRDLYQRELLALNLLCDGVWLCPKTCIWVIIDTTAFFSALFVFDISGDNSGWLVASIAFSIPMLCVPVVLRLIFKWRWCFIQAPAAATFVGDGGTGNVVKSSTIQLHTEQQSPLAFHDL
jgi:hypothetical protein